MVFFKRCYYTLIASIFVIALVMPACAKGEEPEHIRGQIISLKDSTTVVKTKDGKKIPIVLPDNLTVISLTKGSYTKVDFGVYVGSVAVKLDEFSPIVRDSLSWLHKGFELRIIDEQLRGIALGHQKWDLTSDSIIAHGWVDDIEDRVLSIKYGPTEIEETDVEVPRGAPVHIMKLGKKDQVEIGKEVFIGANKDKNGDYVASFIFVGKDGSVPSL